MKELPLTLKDFNIPRTEVNIEEIKKYDSEEEFMSLVVELLKEVAQISSILSCTYRLDEKNNPRKWKRNEAVLGGLMVRLVKLQSGLLDQICQNRLEIANILFRCLCENIINLEYLLKRSTDDLFDEYIEYSLREEKRLLNKIEKNIVERGYEIPIETRMKRSINRAFKISSFSTEQVDEKKWKPWGEKIYERAKKTGMEDIYFATFSLPSHAVHGNWQDLITYHLEHEKGEFSPKLQWGYPSPQPLFAVSFLSAKVNKDYSNEIIPDCSDKDKINKILDEFIVRISVADDLHEQFLQNYKKVRSHFMKKNNKRSQKMKSKKRTIIDITDVDLRKEDLLYFIDVIKNRQYGKDRFGRELDEEESKIHFRLLMFLRHLIAGLDHPKMLKKLNNNN